MPCAALFAAALAAQLVPDTRLTLTDLTGRVHDLGQNPASRVRVFVCLGAECPVSNGQLPALARLHAAHPGAEVYGVVSDSGTTRAAAVAHFAGYAVPFPVLFDPSGLLAAALRPTHVPEAFVLDPAGRLVYRGAVDNGWETVGRRRPRVEREYLADAVAAVTAGRRPLVHYAPPVGCPVEPPAAPAAVSYARDVAPLLNGRCLSCHQDGQVAPFALATYEQAAKRAGQLADVAADRRMPPWMPAGGHERLVGDRRLGTGEIAVLRRWADAGRLRGDAADLPPAPAFADGWALGPPDLVLAMPEPFTVPADGPDLLHHFVLPSNLPADKLVAAVEFRPGNRRVVHHSVLFLDDTGTARKLDAAHPGPGYGGLAGPGFLPSGALGGWSVGNTPRRLPGGMGRYMKKGADVVVQVHYHPTGKPETDRSEVGLYFVDRPVAESLRRPNTLVGSIWAANYQMDIPAGAADYRRTAAYTLPKAVTLVGVVPHMHLLGKAMRVTAELPDGTVRPVLDIRAWDYNWQDEYYFERPFRLPAGTRLVAEAAFDNSAGNPANPSSPPKRVTWGEGSLDEMLFCFFLLTADRSADLVHVVLDNLAHDAKQPRAAVR